MPGRPKGQSRGHRLPLNPRQRLPVAESRSVRCGPIVLCPRCCTTRRCRIERGDTAGVSLGVLEKLARALGIDDPAYLIVTKG